ncbi:MAG: alpha/beta fold hydrolase [Ruegeria sp.]
MADFLLVHGSCHGAWCWRDLIPELSAMGQTARAIDLPSHGADTTPIADVTMENCRDAILSATTPQTIVLGHSWGGFPVSAAAEAAPDAMRAVIYLSAYVPRSGLSMIEMRKRAPRQLLLDAVEKSADGLSYTARPDKVRDIFYHDCSPEDLEYAIANLCPQAILPQDTPVTLTERFDRVPKGYIRSLDDRAVPTEYQQEMSKVAAANMRHTIDSSHSAFFSHPRELAEIITRIEEKI